MDHFLNDVTSCSLIGQHCWIALIFSGMYCTIWYLTFDHNNWLGTRGNYMYDSGSDIGWKMILSENVYHSMISEPHS